MLRGLIILEHEQDHVGLHPHRQQQQVENWSEFDRENKYNEELDLKSMSQQKL